MPRDGRRLLHRPLGQVVALRADHVDADAEHQRGVHERHRDVVAVADVGDRASLYGAPLLAQRQHVRQGLARVLVVAEGVDHPQARRGRGERLEHLLRERPDDNAIDPAFEVARNIRDRLTLAQCRVRLERHDVAPELDDRDFERGARAQRCLLEQHRDVTALERIGRRRLPAERTVGLHMPGNLEAPLEIGSLEVEDREEILAGWRGGAHKPRFGTRR